LSFILRRQSKGKRDSYLQNFLENKNIQGAFVKATSNELEILNYKNRKNLNFSVKY